MRSATGVNAEKQRASLDSLTLHSPPCLVELTKRNKLLLAVAGAGLVAVGVDQVLLTEHASTSSQASSDAATQAGAMSTTTRVVAFNPAAKAVGERLEEFAPSVKQTSVAGDDMFSPPSTWFSASQAKTIAQPQQLQDRRVSEPIRLASELKLTAVASKPTPTAVVNGELLRAGKQTKVKVTGGERTVTLVSVEGPNRTKGSTGQAIVLIDKVRVTLQIAQSVQARSGE
jgi:hypothetical protein